MLNQSCAMCLLCIHVCGFFVFFSFVFKELKTTNKELTGLLGRVTGLPFPQQALSNHHTEAAFHVCKGCVPVKRGSLSEDLGYKGV